MDFAEAYTKFEAAMQDPTNLVDIHKLVKSGPGRRTRESALNRAIVVLTVAAWQAYVQDVAREAIDRLKPPKGDPHIRAWNLINSQATRDIRNFSTPNAENTRDLLQWSGFDPQPFWRWAYGPEVMTPADCAERMNRWLKVRHAIAHGHDDLPDVGMLSKLSNGERSLQRANAEACMLFFRRITERTNKGIQKHFAGI